MIGPPHQHIAKFAFNLITEGKSLFCIPVSLCEAPGAEDSPFLTAQIFENIQDQGGNDL
jgi:hypothetical protein